MRQGLVLVGAVTLAVAGASLGSFGVLGGLALGEDGALQDGCFASGSCTPDDVATLDSLTLGADISWISAAAIGTVGVVLLAIGLSAGGEETARVTPVLGPQLAGVAVHGGF